MKEFTRLRKLSLEHFILPEGKLLEYLDCLPLLEELVLPEHHAASTSLIDHLTRRVRHGESRFELVPYLRKLVCTKDGDNSKVQLQQLIPARGGSVIDHPIQVWSRG